MGENLFKITEENFDMNKVVGQRLQLYKDLVGVSESVSQVN